MTDRVFDIRASLFGGETDLGEEAVEEYERELACLFEESPEGKAVAAEGVELGFARSIIHYLLGHVGVAVPEMTTEDFEEVLFDLVPAKVSVEPEEARNMILEARGFCAYLRRAHGLDNATECLAVIEDDAAIDRLREALADPGNWGMAKSMVMEGMARGFDVSSKEGLEQWFAAYNASLPPLPARSGGITLGAVRRTDAARRKKRKQQKAARRKNR